VRGGGGYPLQNKRKLVVFLTLLLVLTVGIFFSYSRATLKKQESVADATLKVGTLSYTLKMNGIETVDISAEPLKWSYADIEVTNNNPIDTKYEVVYTYVTGYGKATIEYFGDNDAPSGVIKAGETKKTRLRIYNSLSASFATEKMKLKVLGSLINDTTSLSSSDHAITKAEAYKEDILHGTDPVLTSNLVPVNISDNGTVTKASAYDAWYEYSQRRWANAVVLVNKTNYSAGAVIPESNIQSYFVWIPRYKYQIFNTGNYTSLTSLSSTAVQTINVVFENKNTAVSNGSSVNTWLTHPAFTSFNSNGFWVGKFESGYKGATSKTGAEQNNNNYANLIIKPNVYSWRGITVGNMFKVSYDYLRSDDSHMMKNTEWGAVAYLQHSSYGSRASVRVNNNSSCLTGYAAVTEPTCGQVSSSTSCNTFGTSSSITKPYNTTVGYTASTTGNITGIYDMSGGSDEGVMGYNTNATKVGGESNITSLYSDFFTSSNWDKYYDKYSNNTNTIDTYNKRILGDATGEMGPFAAISNNQSRSSGSWYNDESHFVANGTGWIRRGGYYNFGFGSGIFEFRGTSGGNSEIFSFRVVLTP